MDKQSEERGLIDAVKMVTETVRSAAKTGRLTKGELTALRKLGIDFTFNVNQAAKIIKGHPHQSARAYGLAMLHSAILRAVLIGNRAGINPITERLGAEAKRESIAQARRVRDENSKTKNQILFEAAKPLWAARPTLRRSAGATAKAIWESDLVKDLGLGLPAIEKRLRNIIIKSRKIGQ